MRAPLILLALLPMLAACGPAPESTNPPATPAIAWGESTPGEKARIFSPGQVSVAGRYEYGVSVSPDGSELIVTAHLPDETAALILYRRSADGWIEAGALDLTRGTKGSEMEAFFTPDGGRLYFAPFDGPGDIRIWAVDREDEGWGEARPLGGALADTPAFFPTSAMDGTIYFTNLAERAIYRARLDGDDVVEAEDAGLGMGHPFVAPDESFLLLDRRTGEEGAELDIYVAFRSEDGGWAEPVKLGPGVNTEHSESCPALSPDGRFLFFSRYDEPGEISNIYWVSTSVLEGARAGS